MLTPRYHGGHATLDLMLADMWDKANGAFITNTSAIDTEDREGGVYLWDKAALKKLLTPAEHKLATRYWGLARPADFEFGYLPLHLTKPSKADSASLKAIYAKLKVERSQRGLPKDNKLLAGLNGLALIALSDAAALEPRFKPAAARVRDFLVTKLNTPQGLLKGYAQGTPLGAGDLEDYAYVSTGLLAYARMANSEPEREIARKLVADAWQKFHHPRGWQLEQQPLLARPYYQAIVPDGATYSAASLIVKASWELGGKDLRTAALKALNVGYPILDQGVFWYATQLSAMNAVR